MYVSGYNNPWIDGIIEKLDDKSDDAPAREVRLPLGIDLRRKLLAKHHDLFEAKIVADLEGELAALKRLHKLGSWRRMVAADLGLFDDQEN